MKKPHFNKENLTVTQEEYQKLNGGNAYKLGGKTLRFLKRMGKLESTEREEKWKKLTKENKLIDWF